MEKLEWVAPIVVAGKPNNRIKFFDFSTKFKFNTLPTQEELYQVLQGGEKFIKLDLTDACWHMKADEESRKILVIKTHKGLWGNVLEESSFYSSWKKQKQSWWSGIGHDLEDKMNCESCAEAQ